MVMRPKGGAVAKKTENLPDITGICAMDSQSERNQKWT
jgi:hypothetical protein